MTPISHRDHPELRDRPPAHPCTVCGHAVSESWWREGYDTCSLHSLGVKPGKKRTLQQEGNEMANKRMPEERQREVVRLHNQGLSPSQIAQRMEPKSCNTTIERVLAEKGITPHKAENARPVTVYRREPEPRKKSGKAAKNNNGKVTPTERPTCYGATDCPLPEPESCDHFDACLNELKEWAASATTSPLAEPVGAVAEGTSTSEEATAPPATIMPERSCQDCRYDDGVEGEEPCVSCCVEENHWTPKLSGSESCTTNPVQKDEPAPMTGHCACYRQPVTTGNRCPNAEAGYRTDCSPECPEWRERATVEVKLELPEDAIQPEPGWCALKNTAYEVGQPCGYSSEPCFVLCEHFRTDAQVLAAAREKLMEAVDSELAEMGPEHVCKTCRHLDDEPLEEPCYGCAQGMGETVADRWEPISGRSETKEEPGVPNLPCYGNSAMAADRECDACLINGPCADEEAARSQEAGQDIPGFIPGKLREPEWVPFAGRTAAPKQMEVRLVLADKPEVMRQLREALGVDDPAFDSLVRLAGHMGSNQILRLEDVRDLLTISRVLYRLEGRVGGLEHAFITTD